jgi:ABC-type transporter Mla maintaining outer membrane lipid asymmetry ATPase subunit MlaF
MRTYVINFLGGSGLGKSTTAALVFGALKLQRQNCELVREYVKEMAWAGIGVGPFGQSIIYGRQLER